MENENSVNVVRCQDCEYVCTFCDSQKLNLICKKHSMAVTQDFYCAAGRQKCSETEGSEFQRAQDAILFLNRTPYYQIRQVFPDENLSFNICWIELLIQKLGLKQVTEQVEMYLKSQEEYRNKLNECFQKSTVD